MPIPYYHVDSFTGELFAGNPAGVCILAAFLPDSTMQKIAAENRYSETAFVVPRADVISTSAGSHLKWKTIFAGTQPWRRRMCSRCGNTARPVRFHTCSGVLTVALAQDGFEMDFPAWPPQPCEPPAELLPALGLKAAQVMKARDYVVVVDCAEQVRALSPDIRALAKLDIGIGGTIVTAPGEDDVDYVLRFFSPSVGIEEDPATGSIHCTLAPYWAARLRKQTLRARQLSSRGGEMRCEIAGDRVKVSGQARLYLQGTIEVQGDSAGRLGAHRFA